MDIQRYETMLTHTHTQVENEFASLVRGDEGTKSLESLPPLLRPVQGDEQVWIEFLLCESRRLY